MDSTPREGIRVAGVPHEALAMTSTVLVPAAGSDSRPGDSCGQTIHRVVLIDPRRERLAITSLVVEQSAALSVVGLAANLAEAESQIRDARADVAVVEIQMPVPEGLATIAALRARFGGLRIVVCSFHSDLTTRDAARAQGADGYLIKPLQVADLLALVVAPVSPAPTDGDSAKP